MPHWQHRLSMYEVSDYIGAVYAALTGAAALEFRIDFIIVSFFDGPYRFYPRLCANVL